jgi:hypothetical protein
MKDDENNEQIRHDESKRMHDVDQLAHATPKQKVLYKVKAFNPVV